MFEQRFRNLPPHKTARERGKRTKKNEKNADYKIKDKNNKEGGNAFLGYLSKRRLEQ